MNKTLVVTARNEPRVSLRAAESRDLEDLRAWKNANKAGFFFQDEITPQMQKTWYESYLSRPNDFMFIVEHGEVKIGCMAFRVSAAGDADAYNIIAAPGGAGKGLMKAAMTLMCSYIAATRTKDIGCLVLKGNPAAGYYQRCGFNIVGDGGDHHIFKLDWTRAVCVPYDILEK